MNLVVLLGRTTKDIELRVTQSGTSVARFTLAVNRAYAKEGEDKKADFIPCVAFGKTAETLSKYVGIGRQIAVEGRLQVNSYEKSDGTKAYSTNVIVERFYFADSKQGGQAQTNYQTGINYQPEPQQTEQDAMDGFEPLTDSDDDLPF